MTGDSAVARSRNGPAAEPHPASFRDPAGVVFERDGVLLRQVNQGYGDAYDRLMDSGLHATLVKEGLMVDHEEVDASLALEPGAYKVLRPEPVPFVSYPYEWCFGQLRAAALLTLRLQRLALDVGLSLKDATAYNVQFVGSRPVFIDTLSFERHQDGEPWVAYRQFCEHFLAPLALMAYSDVRLGRLLRLHVDGVPLDLAAACAPARARLRGGLLAHLFLHARTQRRAAADGDPGAGRGRFTRRAFDGLLDHLEATVTGLEPRADPTPWADYYETHRYTDAGMQGKRDAVDAWLERVAPRTVWDLGANAGDFSRLAAARGAYVVAFDLDHGAVERNHARAVEDGDPRVLPLLLDLANPSPGIGWANRERASLADRGPADLVLALALVHHLGIGNNLPFPRLAAHLAELGRHAIVEWVPPHDPQALRLVRGRDGAFPHYDRDAFEAAFEERFHVLDAERVPDSDRVLFLLENRRPTR